MMFIQWSIKKKKMKNPLLEYIVQKQKTANKYLIFRKIEVDCLIDGIDLSEVISTLEKRIPEYFFNGLKKIYIGDFRNDDDQRSFYKDFSLYVTVNNEEDLLRDICHELCHFLFDSYVIFDSPSISDEFIGKRRRLFDILSYEGYNPSRSLFARSDYNEKMDDYLHNEVGYGNLTSNIIGLFPDPYSVTSIQEYVSTCFEFFFIKDREYIKKICPATYKMLDHLIGKNGKLYFVLRA